MDTSDLWNKLVSGHKIVVVETNEERRVIADIMHDPPVNAIFTLWSPGTKLRRVGPDDEDPFQVPELTTKVNAPKVIANLTQELADGDSVGTNALHVYILCNLSIGMVDAGPTTARMIKNILPVLQESMYRLVILTEECSVHPMLSCDYTKLVYSLKSQEELIEWVTEYIDEFRDFITDPVNKNRKTTVGKKTVKMPTAYKLDYSKDEVGNIAAAAGGLTIQEASLAVKESFKMHGELNPTMISSMKKNIVEKSGLIEWHEPDNMDNVGGMENLKEWLKIRGASVSNSKASDYGLPAPKGIMLLGPPGSGKSLICKAIASLWSLPLIRLDLGKVMDRYVGGSEAKLRQALSIVEATAPCTIWLDEIDKSLSGTQSSTFTDGGTLSRVFGTLLTWMQENKSMTFIVATCNAMLTSNNQLLLPPELQRKGRFDEIFYVDIPTEDEAVDIFRIHITKPRREHPGRDAGEYDLAKLASIVHKAEDNVTYRYTGAEIEASIIDAMFLGFSEGREFTTEDIAGALGNMIPLSFTMRSTIDELRKFGQERCRPASKIPMKAKRKKRKVSGTTDGTITI